MRNTNRIVWIGSVSVFLTIALTVIGWLLMNSQSSEVVTRTTFADGSQKVLGGRVPWRRPDFAVYATENEPLQMEARGSDGVYRKIYIIKFEIWLRDKEAKERLRQISEALSKLQPPEGSPTSA